MAFNAFGRKWGVYRCYLSLEQAIGRAARTYFSAWLRPARDMEKLITSHRDACCLTWSHLLPQIEMLIASLGETCCLTISQAQSPEPSVIYIPTRAWEYTSPYGHPTWLEQFHRLSPDEDRRCDNHEDRGRRGADGPILPV